MTTGDDERATPIVVARRARGAGPARPESRPELTRALAAELAALLSDVPAGEATADDVARALARFGVRGHRFGVETCPVAVYLRRRLGYRDAVQVCSGEARWRVRRLVPGLAPWASGHDVVVAPLPAAVALFVRLFDLGAFPGLRYPGDPPRAGQASGRTS